MLRDPTPPAFAYFFDVFLRYDGGAPVIWPISISEYVVIALLRFLAAARDSAVGFACIVLRMPGDCRCVLVLLPCGAHREVDDISFLEIPCSSGSDPVASLFACNRSSKIDLA